MSKEKQKKNPRISSFSRRFSGLPFRPSTALRGGFTLVEMLVVIGVIGLLAGALLGAFTHLKTSARQAQAQALVGEVATALTAYLQQYREWPEALTKRTEMDETACWVLQQAKLLDVTGKRVASDGTIEENKSSLDRFGLLDPWGRAALRRTPSISSSEVTIEGGRKLSEHRLQYCLDLNYDGYVDALDKSPIKDQKIRASAIVWSRGPDGKDDYEASGKRYPIDDRLSWNYGQARSKE